MTRWKCTHILRLLRCQLKLISANAECEDKEIYDDEIEAISAAINDVNLVDKLDKCEVTNGAMMKAMFPHAKVEFHKTFVRLVDGDFYIPCDTDWWNGPYRGDINEQLDSN